MEAAPGKPSLASIPPELIHETISYFGCTSDVAHLALVCSSLNTIVSPILYRTVIVGIEPVQGVTRKYSNSLLRLRSPRQQKNMTFVRTFGVIGKLRSGKNPIVRAIVEYTLLYIRSILDTIDKDLLTSFIWDTDMILSNETQRSLLAKQRNITSLTICQYKQSASHEPTFGPPDPFSLDRPINWDIFGIGPLNKLHVEGIGTPAMLQAIISAIEKNSKTLVHLGLGFHYRRDNSFNDVNNVSDAGTITGTGVAQFPALSSLQIRGVGPWDNFISQLKLDVLGCESWQGVERLVLEHNGPVGCYLEALKAHTMRPASLNLTLADTASLPKLRDYFDNCDGLVEVCIRLKGPLAEDGSFGMKFAKTSKTLKRLFLGWTNGGTYFHSSQEDLKALSELEALEELAIAYEGPVLFHETKFPALKLLWLLDINQTLACQIPTRASRLTSDTGMINVTQIRDRYFPRSILPPNLRIIAFGQYFLDFNSARPAVITAVYNCAAPWPLFWPSVTMERLDRPTFERYYKGFQLFQMREGRYFRDLQFRPKIKEGPRDEGAVL
ncbi:hypothetical protein TWF718_010489 [Orbilia javanica]|uniref:F-box domain-containing protein n=1 Tax=Orbilia javanica TaxID=47235 RepID=A0AAN8MM23_9PEZI